jgi:hypothetical protein
MVEPDLPVHSGAYPVRAAPPLKANSSRGETSTGPPLPLRGWGGLRAASGAAARAARVPFLGRITMIVKFEDPKCKCCPLSPHGYGQTDGNKPPLVLVPGINTISTQQYEVLKKDEIFIHRVQTGMYKVDEKISGDSIAGLHEADAIDLVSETLDRNILRKWLVDEQRRTVREAIDAQLEKVKPEMKDDKGGKK